MKRLFNKIFDWRQYLQHSILVVALAIAVSQMLPLPASATGVSQLPKITPGDRPWVIDQAEAISRVNEGKISNDLEKLAKETGNEVRIVTIRRFDYGDTAESFTQALFEKWFPTPAAQANQTVLVLDTLSSGTAIRSGEAAKSLLSDDIARSVANETILAPLKAGEKYNQAFLDASDRLIAVLSGKPDPGPPQITASVSTESTFKSAEETDAGNATVWVIGLVLAATIIPMATYYLYVK